MTTEAAFFGIRPAGEFGGLVVPDPAARTADSRRACLDLLAAAAAECRSAGGRERFHGGQRLRGVEVTPAVRGTNLIAIGKHAETGEDLAAIHAGAGASGSQERPDVRPASIGADEIGCDARRSSGNVRRLGGRAGTQREERGAQLLRLPATSALNPEMSHAISRPRTLILYGVRRQARITSLPLVPGPPKSLQCKR